MTANLGIKITKNAKNQRRSNKGSKMKFFPQEKK